MMIDFYEISLVKINDNSFNLEKKIQKNIVGYTNLLISNL